MGKTFIKGFGFIDDNDELVQNKLVTKKINDTTLPKRRKKRVANVERVVKSTKSK